MLRRSPRARPPPAGPQRWLRRACLALAAVPAPPRAPPQEPARARQGLDLVTAAEDLTASGLAFVELETARDTLVVGEPFELRLSFGLEREFQRASLLQLFPRPLDVPVQVFAPALESLEGARLLPAAEPDAGASVALGERIVRAAPAGERTRAGRTYAVYELTREAVATRAGKLVLAAPALGFAYATRFEDDFLHGRLALDRREARVRGRARELTILPLPEEGRPPEFTGAIGRVALTAAATPETLEAGQGLELVLSIEARGRVVDLSQCEPPRLDALPGFHLRGAVVEREAERLTARYDLVPEPGVREVPAISFAYFDLEPPAGYRTLASEPIPLRVLPGASVPAAEPSAAPAAPAPAGPSSRARTVAALVLLLLALLALLMARRRRARERR